MAQRVFHWACKEENAVLRYNFGFAMNNIHMVVIMPVLFFGFQSIAKLIRVHYGFRAVLNVNHVNKVRIKTWLR